MATCFLSPHSDDIVMSAATIIQKSLLPRPYYLFTVFGASEYVDASRKKLYAPAKITQLRLQEDRVFCGALDLEFRYLLLPDCLLREGQVFFRPDKPLDTGYLGSVQEQIGPVLRQLAIQTLVIQHPWGPRQHYDHRLVQQAAENLAQSEGYLLYYLDDIPYSVLPAGAPELIPFWQRQLSQAELKRKYALMALYPSQMSRYFYQRVKKAAQESLYRPVWDQIRD